MAQTKETPRAAYSGGTFRDLIRSYGIDRMQVDPVYRRDVRKALQLKRDSVADRVGRTEVQARNGNATP
jgi:hypothetical protein